MADMRVAMRIGEVVVEADSLEEAERLAPTVEFGDETIEEVDDEE